MKDFLEREIRTNNNVVIARRRGSNTWLDLLKVVEVTAEGRIRVEKYNNTKSTGFEKPFWYKGSSDAIVVL